MILDELMLQFFLPVRLRTMDTDLAYIIYAMGMKVNRFPKIIQKTIYLQNYRIGVYWTLWRLSASSPARR